MTRTFDPTKPVRTRDGRPARIICTDRKGVRPLVVLIEKQAGEESVFYYGNDGRHPWKVEPDLVNIPERHVRWINIYDPPETCGYLSRGSAEQGARDAPWRRIACVRIEFEEGEGLT